MGIQYYLKVFHIQNGTHVEVWMKTDYAESFLEFQYKV
jgi:hypothetical protein